MCHNFSKHHPIESASISFEREFDSASDEMRSLFTLVKQNSVICDGLCNTPTTSSILYHQQKEMRRGQVARAINVDCHTYIIHGFKKHIAKKWNNPSILSDYTARIKWDVTSRHGRYFDVMCDVRMSHIVWNHQKIPAIDILGSEEHIYFQTLSLNQVFKEFPLIEYREQIARINGIDAEEGRMTGMRVPFR